MISCTVYRCKRRPGNPCCTYCDDKTCPEHCQNHPSRCKVWREALTEVGKQKRRRKYDREKILNLRRHGRSIREIADRVGCSRSLVSQTLQGSGVQSTNSGRQPKFDYDAIRALREEGLTLDAIADRIGCSNQVVRKALRRKEGRADG